MGERIEISQIDLTVDQTQVFHDERGFSLVEVLVALLVLAVGMLGLAALQNMGLRLGHQSYERTQATLLIYEMIDRMRANPAGVTNGDYSIPSLTNTAPTAATDCGSGACTPTQMAKYDMNQWISTITGASGAQNTPLTGGEGAIVKAAATSRYDISIRWQEQDVGMLQTVTVQLP